MYRAVVISLAILVEMLPQYCAIWMPIIQEEYWELESVQKRATRIAENIQYHERQQKHHMYLFAMEKMKKAVQLLFEYLFGDRTFFNRLPKVAKMC